MKKDSCQSCLLPFNKDQGKRESDQYCSYCFKDGKLCYQGNDLHEFQKRCYEGMVGRGMHPWVARFFAWLIRFAPRWRGKNVNKIEITVQEPYAAQILSGRKTVEGRLNRGKFAMVQVGDRVLINNQAEFIITGKNQYKTFREMLEREGVARVIPDAADLEAAVQVYYQFYAPEDEREFGVVGLELQKIA